MWLITVQDSTYCDSSLSRTARRVNLRLSRQSRANKNKLSKTQQELLYRKTSETVRIHVASYSGYYIPFLFWVLYTLLILGIIYPSYSGYYIPFLFRVLYTLLIPGIIYTLLIPDNISPSYSGYYIPFFCTHGSDCRQASSCYVRLLWRQAQGSLGKKPKILYILKLLGVISCCCTECTVPTLQG